MQKMLLMFIVALFSIAYTPVQAQTVEHFNFLGFSKDGKYMAYEVFGVEDGSGFNFSKITLVDVAKNAWTGQQVLVKPENEAVTLNTVRNQAKTKAAAQLKSYGIGNINGRWFDVPFGFDVGTGKMYTFYQPSSSVAQSIDLTAIKTNDASCAVQDVDSVGLKLSLNSNVLQWDKKIPQSRLCATEYDLVMGYAHDRNIALVIRYQTPGFEGRDHRYMVVTGRL